MPHTLNVSPSLKEILRRDWVVTRWRGETYEAWERHFTYTHWLPGFLKDWITRRFGRYTARNVGPHCEKEKDRYIVASGVLDLSVENEQRIEANRSTLMHKKRKLGLSCKT